MDARKPTDEERPTEAELILRDQLKEETDVHDRLAELTLAKVGELARAEIQSWKEEQDEKAPKLFKPNTWGNRTLGGAIAGGMFTIGAVVLGFFNHEELKVWHTAGKISGLARAEFDQGLARPGFQSTLRTQLNQVATAEMFEDGGLSSLIKKQMKALPLLTFHGHETFGEPLSLSIPDLECEARIEQELTRADASEFANLPAAVASGQQGTPPTLEGQCTSEVAMDVSTALDIPFLARFFPKDDSKIVHGVSLMLVVERRHKPMEAGAYASAQPGPPLPELRDATDDLKPAGLCVIYRPANETNRFAETGLLVDSWNRTRDGHWIANLTEILKTAEVFSEDDRAAGDISHLHSVFINAVLPARETGPNVCDAVEPVADQTLSVSAIIMVNNDLYFGSN